MRDDIKTLLLFITTSLLVVILAHLITMSASTSSSSSPTTTTTTPFRVVTVNTLFDAFYQKYAKTATKYPKDQRIAATISAFDQEPFISAAVINFQEFDIVFIEPLKQRGFHVCLSDNPRANNTGDMVSSAYVATAVKKNSFKVRATVSIALEPNGSKALLLTTITHLRTGTSFLIGNAHVPWASSKEAFAPFFKLIGNIMMRFSPVASVFSGDWNSVHSTFEASIVDHPKFFIDGKPTVLNAISDLPFSYLAQNNFASVIDHMWYTPGVGPDNNDKYYLKRATMTAPSGTAREQQMDLAAYGMEVPAPKTIMAPTIVLPKTADEMIRHGTDIKNGAADFGTYFSDHATIAADFEFVSSSAQQNTAPSLAIDDPSFLLALAVEVGQQTLGGQVSVVLKEPALLSK